MKGSHGGTPRHLEIILGLIKNLRTLKTFLTSILQLPPVKKVMFLVEYVVVRIFQCLRHSEMLILHCMLHVGKALASAANHEWAVRHSYAGADVSVRGGL